jgi:regulator of nucleoside diphosphate kinase
MRSIKRIVVTRADLARLRAILRSSGGSVQDREHVLDLRDELDRARVVAEHEISSDVVTIGSQVRVLDRTMDTVSDYTIVSPAQANVALGRISVLAPLGTALLGYRKGDEVEWQMPGGIRLLQIERVKQVRPEPRRRHCEMNTSAASSA